MKIGVYDRDDQLFDLVDHKNKEIVLVKLDQLTNLKDLDVILINADYYNNYEELRNIIEKDLYIILAVETVDHLDELLEYHVAMLSRPYKKEYVDIIFNRFYGRIYSSLVIKSRNTHNNIVRIPFDDIYYMASDKRIINIYGKNNEFIGKTYKKIGDMEQMLPVNFQRPHQSFIINENYITKENYNEIYLDTINVPIPISKSRKKRKKFTSF